MRSQPGSRNHSVERRGRSHTVRSQEHTPETTTTPKVVEYQFRPPEVVKNIQRIPNNRTTSFEKSTSRETSTARRERLNINEPVDEKKRSTSVTSANYRNARAHSNLNPNVNQNGNQRYRTPMSAYSTHEGVDTIVPNYSNILYQKYQRPSISSRPSNESRISYQTPKSNVSVTMDSNDLVPAFNELTMELGEAMNENIEQKKHGSIFEVDNKYADSNPQSLKSGSDSDNEAFPEETVNSSLSEAISEDKKESQQQKEQQPKMHEKFGRIQQRVNFLKQMKDEESNSTSTWKNMSVEQRMFFEYLNNDLRTLRRSKYKPLHDSLERTRRDNQVLDSSASVTSQYLLKTYNPLKEGKHYSLTPQLNTQQQTIQQKIKEVDHNKLKSLLTHGNNLAESMWKTEEEHRPSQITLKSERGEKSSTDTAVSSINSDSMSVKLVTHTFEPKDLDAIKESFDGYELNSHNEPGDQQHLTDSKHPSPLTQRY